MSDGSDGLIRFSEGLIGFPEAQQFQLLASENTAVRILRCLDKTTLQLPVIDPRVLDPSYQPHLCGRVKSSLALEPEHDVILLAIVVLQPDGPALANLRAPLVINAANCIGTQVIVDDNAYSTRTPIAIHFPETTQDASQFPPDRRSHVSAEQTNW